MKNYSKNKKNKINNNETLKDRAPVAVPNNTVNQQRNIPERKPVKLFKRNPPLKGEPPQPHTVSKNEVIKQKNEVIKQKNEVIKQKNNLSPEIDRDIMQPKDKLEKKQKENFNTSILQYFNKLPNTSYFNTSILILQYLLLLEEEEKK